MQATPQLVSRFTNNRELIQWLPMSGKWSDPGNDVWCHPSRQLDQPEGSWEVAHRYGFDAEGKVRYLVFPNQTEAMEFYVNYLYARATHMAPRS